MKEAIQFWLAKSIAELIQGLLVVGVIAALVGLYMILDAVSRRLEARARAREEAQCKIPETSQSPSLSS